MIKLYANICDFCGTCVGICPENCIEMQEYSLTIDNQLCTLCQQCIWVCPLGALYMEDENDD